MEITAYHECGHAYLAYRYGGWVQRLTLEPDYDDGPPRHGDTEIHWPLDRMSDRDLAAASLTVALAGPVAEIVYTGEPYHPGFVAEWAADWNDAMRQAETLVAGVMRRLVYLEQVTRELIGLFQDDHHWAAVAALADELLAHETLYREEIEETLRFWTS